MKEINEWKLPAEGKPREKWWAVVTCPECSVPGTLTRAIHSVAADGTVTPSYICPHTPCTFHEWVRLAGWGAP